MYHYIHKRENAHTSLYIPLGKPISTDWFDDVFAPELRKRNTRDEIETVYIKYNFQPSRDIGSVMLEFNFSRKEINVQSILAWVEQLLNDLNVVYFPDGTEMRVVYLDEGEDDHPIHVPKQ